MGKAERAKMDSLHAEVVRLRAENADLALALSAVRSTLSQHTHDGDVAEWAARLLTAFADRGVARQYSGKWQEAHDRFWQAIQDTPATVRERIDPNRAYFWEREYE